MFLYLDSHYICNKRCLSFLNPFFTPLKCVFISKDSLNFFILRQFCIKRRNINISFEAYTNIHTYSVNKNICHLPKVIEFNFHFWYTTTHNNKTMVNRRYRFELKQLNIEVTKKCYP